MRYACLKFRSLRGVRGGEGIAGALQGDYDLKGDVISGRVIKVPAVSNGMIRVQAWRRHQLIAECIANLADEGWRVSFVMPIENRFSVAELARETVALRIVNDRGDTGVPILNGVTRLELIRAYMGVPVDPVFDIDFARSGNARSYLGPGWSDPEDSFTWMVDLESLISFPSPRAGSQYLIRMRYSTFIPDFVKHQPMEIFVNDVPVGAFAEDEHYTKFREFRFEGREYFLGKHVSTMRFQHPNAIRASERSSSTDSRVLSFCMFRLGLMRILDEDGDPSV